MPMSRRVGIRKSRQVYTTFAVLARDSAETVIKGLSAAVLGRQSVETVIRGASAAVLARQSTETVIRGTSAAVLGRQSVEVVISQSDPARVPTSLLLSKEVGDVRWEWNDPADGTPTSYHDVIEYSTDGGVNWTADGGTTGAVSLFAGGGIAGRAYSDARSSPTVGRLYRARVSAIYGVTEYTFAMSNTVTY